MDRIGNEFIRGILVLLEVTKEVGTVRQEAQRKRFMAVAREDMKEKRMQRTWAAVSLCACARACVWKEKWGMDTWITCDKSFRNV